jgi:hypothetical protein
MKRAAMFGGWAVLVAACGARTSLDDGFFEGLREGVADAGDTGEPGDAGDAGDAGAASGESEAYAIVGGACVHGGAPVCAAVPAIPEGRLWDGCFYVECKHNESACRRCTCHEDGGWKCVSVGCPYCGTPR